LAGRNGDELQQGKAGYTLSAAGFTHKAEDLSGINFETHILYCPDHTLFREKMDGQVTNFQQRIFHHQLNAKCQMKNAKFDLVLFSILIFKI
jgi:hypothetical protein